MLVRAFSNNAYSNQLRHHIPTTASSELEMQTSADVAH